MKGLTQLGEVALVIIAQNCVAKSGKLELTHLLVEGENRVLEQADHRQTLAPPVVNLVKEEEAVLGVSALRCQGEEDQQQASVVKEPHIVVIHTKAGPVVTHLQQGVRQEVVTTGGRLVPEEERIGRSPASGGRLPWCHQWSSCKQK